MMKKIIFTLLLTIMAFNYSNAQDDKGKFFEVIQSENSKDENFGNILLWVAENYNDANEVVKLKDKEQGCNFVT